MSQVWECCAKNSAKNQNLDTECTVELSNCYIVGIGTATTNLLVMYYNLTGREGKTTGIPG